ncbi:MAG: hypothetical protein U0935_16915 [Pirellulales bacterium]
MGLPGVTDEKDLKLLLKKLLENSEETYPFAVVARGPKEGDLLMSKKEKLKKKDVEGAAESEAKKAGGKAVKFDVMVGDCRLDTPGSTTLRLLVRGKAPAKAVACLEHLLIRGPFKTVGFTNVILEELAEGDEGAPPPASLPGSSPVVPPGPSPSGPPPSSPQAPPVASVHPLAAEFSERLKGLLPAIKAAAGTPGGERAKVLASEAGVLARQQDFSRALALLNEVDRALQPTDDPTAFSRRVAELTPRLKEALALRDTRAQQLKTLFGNAQSAATGGDVAQALGLLDEIERLLANATARPPSLATWQDARETAIAALEDLIELVVATQDPDAARVEIALRSIIANLTPAPTTPQQVAELKRYLETDDILTAAEEAPPAYGSVDLRGPLLAALSTLET